MSTDIKTIAADIAWTPYAERRPEVAGTYLWRMPFRRRSDVTVEYLGEMRMRGAGYTSVLSPDCDYWDGYRVLVPAGLQWAPTTEKPKTSYRRFASISGVEPAPCPFCKAVPTWDCNDVHCEWMYGAHDWWLRCCDWAKEVHSADPIGLNAKRNALLMSDPTPCPKCHDTGGHKSGCERGTEP